MLAPVVSIRRTGLSEGCLPAALAHKGLWIVHRPEPGCA